jgi:hypothetical protein
MPTPRDEPETTPMWVKVFGVVAVLFVIAFAALHLAGRGFGPGMHSHGNGGRTDAGAP